MDNDKRIDLLRQRNKDLAEELKAVVTELETHKELSDKQQKNADDLIAELEIIKEEWLHLIDELREYKLRYTVLLNEMVKIKSKMKQEIKRIKKASPWYKNVIHQKE